MRYLYKKDVGNSPMQLGSRLNPLRQNCVSTKNKGTETVGLGLGFPSKTYSCVLPFYLVLLKTSVVGSIYNTFPYLKAIAACSPLLPVGRLGDDTVVHFVGWLELHTTPLGEKIFNFQGETTTFWDVLAT